MNLWDPEIVKTWMNPIKSRICLKKPRYFVNNWWWIMESCTCGRSIFWIFEILKHYGTPLKIPTPTLAPNHLIGAFIGISITSRRASFCVSCVLFRMFHQALVSEPGKNGLGFVGVCRSIFNDNSKNGKAQKLCRYSYSDKASMYILPHPKTISDFNLMILGVRDMFNPYF